MNLRSIGEELLRTGSRISASHMRYLSAKIIHNLRSYETLFLFLDGIDDTIQHDDKQPNLLHSFVEQLPHCGFAHQVKCFVSSRRTELWQSTTASALNVDLNNEPYFHTAVQVYGQHVLHESFNSTFSRPRGCPPSKEVLSLLLEKAEGTFLWIKLVADYSQLQLRNTTLLEVLYDPTTRGLSGLSEYMLHKVVDSLGPTSGLILKWATCAFRLSRIMNFLRLYICRQASKFRQTKSPTYQPVYLQLAITSKR